MPYASTTVRDRIRSQLRRGRPGCALMLAAGCIAVDGEIDYTAKAPHPRSFTADHVIATDQGGDDSIENSQPACWECNRLKSDGRRQPPANATFRTWRSLRRQESLPTPTTPTRGGEPEALGRR